MTLFYTISDDEYELITAIADSSRELAKLVGVKHKTVNEQIRRNEKGIYRTLYRKIEVEDD